MCSKEEFQKNFEVQPKNLKIVFWYLENVININYLLTFYEEVFLLFSI